MSRILALEMSGDRCSVALLHDDQLDVQDEAAARQHAQRALPMVDALLSTAKLTLSDLDAIAFGCGPGSFTGLRIAAGFAQGLAYGADVPVLPVSNLRALAFAQFQQDATKPCIACIDARMDEIYWAAYAPARHVTDLVSLEGEQVSAPEQLTLPTAVEGDWQLAGSGGVFSARLAPEVAVRIVQIDDSCQVSAAHIAQVAHGDLSAGGAASAAESAQPVYIRDEVAWKKLPGRE